MDNDAARPWDDQAKSPHERAEALVAVMTLEQKIAQLHGAMETIDIYAITEQAKQRPGRDHRRPRRDQPSALGVESGRACLCHRPRGVRRLRRHVQ
jgi:hypothetical protein